jgi:hypothetical protein
MLPWAAPCIAGSTLHAAPLRVQAGRYFWCVRRSEPLEAPRNFSRVETCGEHPPARPSVCQANRYLIDQCVAVDSEEEDLLLEAAPRHPVPLAHCAHTTSRSPITGAITTLESARSALSSIRSLSTCRPVRPRPLSHAANRPTVEFADAPLMLRRVRFRRSLGHKRLSPEQLALVPHAPVPTAAQLLQVRTHFTWPRAAQHAACGAHHA